MLKIKMVALMAAFFLAGSVSSMAADLQVSNASFAPSTWGLQPLHFKLASTALDYKFVTAKAVVSFVHDQLSPNRTAQRAFIIPPGSVQDLDVMVDIPGNFDTGYVQLSVYDVVDTLDALLESQKIYTGKFAISFAPAEKTKLVLTSGIIVPPFVNKTLLFDNDFTKVLILLLHEGKSIADIAAETKADTVSVRRGVGQLASYGYVKKTDRGWAPAFAVIDSGMVENIRPAIEKTVTDMYRAIAAAMPEYDSLVSRLAASGKITKDKNNLIDGTSLLYHKFELLLGPVLWDLLGREFTNDGRAFDIFEKSNPCDARMTQYMYMVAGQEENSARWFYYAPYDASGERYYCGPYDVKIACTPLNGQTADGRALYDWTYNEGFPLIFFNYDSARVTEPISLFATALRPLTAPLKGKIAGLFPPSAENPVKGGKYWCWISVVTGLMERLEKDGIAVRDNKRNSFFLFDKTGF